MFLVRMLIAFFVFMLNGYLPSAQPIAGTWRGKVTRGSGIFATTYRLELKLVKKGDSLLGTSYYYANPSHYYRYSVKGFYDGSDASVHWWDDELLESKAGGGLKLASVNEHPLVTTADFNCPGSGIMTLDGEASEKGEDPAFEVHLDKMTNPVFKDEWDELIDNWLTGGSHPDWIDDVASRSRQRTPVPTPKEPNAIPPAAGQKTEPVPPPVVVSRPAPAPPPKVEPEPTVKPLPPPIVVAPPPRAEERKPASLPPSPPTIEEKFKSRGKAIATTIPVEGEFITLQFFDNAEIDGDSISLFLNGKLIFEHVRLSAEAFELKIPVTELEADNELTMVAENLGEIPPNTSFMMAYVNGKRYTARLESTENTSAVIRLQKGAEQVK